MSITNRGATPLCFLIPYAHSFDLLDLPDQYAEKKEMDKKGQLTPDKFGSSMPVTAPAVQSPPFWYRDMEMIIMSYETNADAAAGILPEGPELADDASASIVISNYHFSTFGPYCEAILGISCTWEGKPMTFLPNLFVTQEAPLIAGREIWGYGKKLAHIELYNEHLQ